MTHGSLDPSAFPKANHAYWGRAKSMTFGGVMVFLQRVPKRSSASKMVGSHKFQKQTAQIVGRQNGGSMQVKRSDPGKRLELYFFLTCLSVALRT